MATQPIPAPQASGAAAGPGPGGGFSSPAPAQGDQGEGQLLRLAMGIVSAARMIGNKVPGTVPEIRQINDLIAQVIGKIKGSQPVPEGQAPPV